MSAQMMMFAFLAFSPLATAATTHPIGNVVTLLQELQEKVESEARTEQETFAKFSFWCKSQGVVLNKAITQEDQSIDKLHSAIAGEKQTEIKLDGDKPKIYEYKHDKTLDERHRQEYIKEVEGQIEDLRVEIEANEKAAGESKTRRGKENAVYSDKIKSLTNTVTAVKGAMAAINVVAGGSEPAKAKLLESARTSMKGALALISLVATDKQNDELMNFVSADPLKDKVLKSEGDKAAHVAEAVKPRYAFLELLKELQLKFEDQVVEANTEETNALNSYTLEKQARTAAHAAFSTSKKEKEENLGGTRAAISEDQGELKNVESDKKADTGTLDTTERSCKTKAREWEQRSSTRKNEIESIAMGIKILAKIGGVRTEAPKNPILPASPVAFLQVVGENPKEKAVNLLRATAKTVHSRALADLANQISQHLTGPFDVVNDAIEQMTLHLMGEQTNEDKHKAWCDIEVAKTSKSKSTKDDKLTKLKSSIGSVQAKVAQLGLDIKAADDMVAEINAFMKESTEVRNAGKKEDKLAIKDAQTAQTSIANAMATLQTFYKSSGMVKKEDYELLQQPTKLSDKPSTWDSGYSGIADPMNAEAGVIAILEKIATNFASMEAKTKAQEAEDQKEFDDQMTAHQVEKTRRLQESQAKKSEQKRKNAKLTVMNDQVKHVTNELAAVNKYNTDLQPACVNGDSTAAERKAARTAEIDALRVAQTTLQQAFKAKPATRLKEKAPVSKKAKFLHVKKH